VSADRRPRQSIRSAGIRPGNSRGTWLPPGGGRPWHALTVPEVLALLDADAAGLEADAALRRLADCGPNRLPQARGPGAIRRLLLQFHNLLIYVLLAAAAMTLLLGHVVDASVILAVVLLNAAIGFIQEGRAERALDAIRAMIDPMTTVVRDGQRLKIAADRIVPGDVVLIEAGDRVPADLRLLRARNLQIDEAVLTGDSVTVEKSVEPVAAEMMLAERSSMAYSGTFVTTGQGAGLVIGTGLNTELGRISALLETIETLKTPLIRQMDRFAGRLTVVILGISALAFLFAFAMRDYAMRDAFMIVVGLAVAAIPEGLPATMSITLAIGVQRMAGRNAIIRRLPAVETLGSVSVICSDKTGTLTRNEMTVQSIVTPERTVRVSGAGYEPHGAFRAGGVEFEPGDDAVLHELIRAGLLCNDADLGLRDGAWQVRGDPTEGALVALAMKAGLDPALLRKQFPRTDEIPFDSAHRFMATLHHSHEGRSFILLKGAPERILEMCSLERMHGGDQPLDADVWHRRSELLAREGQRVLALAVAPAAADKQALSFDDAAYGATLLGLAGFIDPPRPEAVEAVRDCRSAGIRVKMITGDHAVTAHEIARQLGLASDPKVLTGRELQAMEDPQFGAAVRATDVFARTTAEHKLRLVQALQANGEVVAMTGDGVNDAPALKRADVGVAMGMKGTEAAKEAAEMVLADDNFASIVAAVREGRTVYDNLMKVIGWTLPTNGGEALTILTALALGLALPITPLQILWINMVTAVALGLTLAFEPTEPGTMQRPPRLADQGILGRRLLWRIGFVSLLFVPGAFGMFFWAEARGLPLEAARTLVVNTIVAMEVFYLFSVRYVHGTALTWRGALGTPAVLVGVAVVAAAQFVFTFAPFMQRLFATYPLEPADFLAVIAIGVALLIIVEIEKLVLRLVGDGARTGRDSSRRRV
jgi:magnesium-transporting ATPase (P-type)